jgi:ketosteroid isomerase-like protein
MVDAVTATAVSIEADETIVSGDWAFTRGVFGATFQSKAGGPAVPQANKYILIWRRQADGSWRIARDIWNGSEPPPQAAAAPTAR